MIGGRRVELCKSVVVTLDAREDGLESSEVDMGGDGGVLEPGFLNRLEYRPSIPQAIIDVCGDLYCQRIGYALEVGNPPARLCRRRTARRAVRG